MTPARESIFMLPQQRASPLHHHPIQVQQHIRHHRPRSFQIKRRLQAHADLAHQRRRHGPDPLNHARLPHREQIHAVDHRVAMQASLFSYGRADLDKQLGLLMSPVGPTRDHRHDGVGEPAVVFVIY